MPHVCPKCGASSLKRIPSDRLLHRIRKLFTERRPHTCRKCGWTGWNAVAESRAKVQRWTIQRQAPDLGGIDVALAPEGHKPDSEA
jgi:hypothetical protein